jgi:LytS/YehU family sensor histidine kinase
VTIVVVVYFVKEKILLIIPKKRIAGRGRHHLRERHSREGIGRSGRLGIGPRMEISDSERRRTAKQLVEAELRALRAQINPHFLFNSLNSVAALIATEPQAAEQMVIRLAKIFRHVLTYHDRPLSSVNEEFSFLETYLEIEKVRFGERLEVNIDVGRS